MSTLTGSGPANPAPWPDPTPKMLEDPLFEAIWQTIKKWDINVPDVYAGYCGATGNHVRAILDGIERSGYRLVISRDDPQEAMRRSGVGNKAKQDDPVERLREAEKTAKAMAERIKAADAGPWARSFEKNLKEAMDEQSVVLRQVTDVAMANEFLAGLERQYANYSEVELKLVDPRTVTHITRSQKQNLSEVMDAPAALAVIVTQKNHTATPVYFPLKIKPTPKQLGAIKEHFAKALDRGSVRLIGTDGGR